LLDVMAFRIACGSFIMAQTTRISIGCVAELGGGEPVLASDLGGLARPFLDEAPASLAVILRRPAVAV